MTARVTMALEPASVFQKYWMCEIMSLGEIRSPDPLDFP